MKRSEDVADDQPTRHPAGNLGVQQWVEVRVRTGRGPADGSRDREVQRRFLDIDYRELVADPIATVRRIYAFFAMPLSAVAAARMAPLPRGRPAASAAASQARTAARPIPDAYVQSPAHPGYPRCNGGQGGERCHRVCPRLHRVRMR